jgi:hypothetical protein
MTEHQDRLNRVRTALWIYVSIAISRLHAWTDFWDNSQDIIPFVTKKPILQSLKHGIENFDTNFRTAYKPIQDSLERLGDFTDGLALIKADIDPSDLIKETPASMYRFVRETLVPLKLDDCISKYDEILTGGMLSANTKEKQRQAAAQRFFIFASIDWMSCFTGAGEDESIHRETYLALNEMARDRLVKTMLYEIATKSDKDDEEELDEVELDEEELDEEELDEEKFNEEELKKIKAFVKSLRSGKRWTEITDLLGYGAIYLKGLLDMISPEEALSKLDIPSVISEGKDDEFELLKHALSTRFQWLPEFCSQIESIVPMIQEAESLRNTDKEKTMSLAKQITERVAEVFGEKEVISQVERSAYEAVPSLNLVKGLLFRVLNYDNSGYWAKPGQKNERKILYEICLGKIFDIFSSSDNKHWNRSEDGQRRVLQQVGETLHHTKEQFLLMCINKADQSVRGSGKSQQEEIQGHQKEFWLSKGLDAFFRMVSETWYIEDTGLSDEQERLLELHFRESGEALMLVFK